MSLLTETADYDDPGSWGRASEGWTEIIGDVAYDMYVFVNCIVSIPYGSYVLMDKRGRYDAKESILRVHADYLDKLMSDFKAAGFPSAEASAKIRNKYGKLDRNTGLRSNATLDKFNLERKK